MELIKKYKLHVDVYNFGYVARTMIEEFDQAPSTLLIKETIKDMIKPFGELIPKITARVELIYHVDLTEERSKMESSPKVVQNP